MREEWVDNLRGFAIICVVWGHFSSAIYSSGGVSYYMTYYIYLFHMPIFFLVSGYLYKISSKNESFFKIIKKKTFNLLIPAVFMGMGLFFINYFMNNKDSCFVLIKKVLSQDWFLLTMWMVSIIAYISKQYFSTKLLIGGNLIVMLISGLLNNSIAKVFLYLCFYFIGIYYSEHKEILTKCFFEICCIIFFPFSIWYCYKINGMQIVNCYYKFFLGVLSCYILLYIFQTKQIKSKMLCFFGRNSLEIYIFHVWLYLLLKDWLARLAESYGNELAFFISLCIGFGIPILLIKLDKKNYFGIYIQKPFNRLDRKNDVKNKRS